MYNVCYKIGIKQLNLTFQEQAVNLQFLLTVVCNTNQVDRSS